MTDEPSMRDFADEETFQPKITVLEMDEAKIDSMAEKNPMRGITACDLEGHDLCVHTWLKIELRYDEAGDLALVTVLDCDRKGQK